MPVTSRRPKRPAHVATLRRAAGQDACDAHALCELVAAAPDARALGDARFAFDTADGRNLIVEVADDALRFLGTLEPKRRRDEEHGGWEDDPHANDVLEELAATLARPVQARTRWTLELALSHGRVAPEMPCSACGNACFTWETTCVRCGAGVWRSVGAVPVDAGRRAARVVVDRLLAVRAIALAPGHARADLEERLAAELARSVHVERIHAMLMSDPAIDEVFCDVEELAPIAFDRDE